MWAKITIGGKVSRLVLTGMMEKFSISQLLLQEAASPPGPEVADLEAIRHLELEDDEAHEGRFEELETYLMEQAIPFDRLSDGKYEYSPELRKFRPCLSDNHGSVLKPEIDRTFPCDHDNRPMVALADVNQALAETETREELAACLIELCGLDIPDLSPLHIVKEIS